MRKRINSVLITLILIILNNISVHSQSNKEMEGKVDQIVVSDGSIEIMASNFKDVPQIVVIDFPELKNMKSSEPLPIRKVLEAKAENVLVGKLIPIPEKSYHNQMEYTFYPGNILEPKIDKDFVYELPFEKAKSYTVIQGYGGPLSHNLKNHFYCLDFDFEKGDKVYAARSGIVFAVKEDSDRHGSNKSASKYGNYVTILHNDGSYANYYHLQQNGSLVNVGDKVEKAQQIALSGNTGWSSGPHLHFEVYYYNKDGEFISIPTKFNISKTKTGQLEEGKSYSR
ncbi:MAG TPA: M23 family metallopeptidase [Saprospiraceae bacterium]|nr:M23 family metallopeptidase [Saprospiraceae bacterium]